MKTDPTLDLLVGHAVSHIWFGDYSALYFELGELTPSKLIRRDGSSGNPRGEFTVYAGFDWRIERPRSVYGSRDCTRRRQRSITAKLLGTMVTSAGVFGRLPELQIGFSSGMWLTTFGLGRGDPDWSVSFRRPSVIHLSTTQGRLSFDRRDSKPPKQKAEQAVHGNTH
jgi:hypothetical protein